MKLRVIYHELFWPDVEAASQWYDRQQPGLGERFEAAVARAVNQAIESPRSFRLLEEELRRVLLRRFRYQVVFEIHGSLLLFYGVVHTSRRLGRWQRARVRPEEE